MNTRRTFIAIKIKPSQNLTGFYKRIQDELKRSSIKWVDINNLHITLAFLGNSTETQIKNVELVLSGITERYHAFDFTLRGFGFFGHRQSPRVLWMGVKGGEDMSALRNELWKELPGLGFTAEEHAFSPHLTLGRVKEFKDQPALQNLARQFEETAFQDVPVDEIIFYESILNPSGPAYKPIRHFVLCRAEQT